MTGGLPAHAGGAQVDAKSSEKRSGGSPFAIRYQLDFQVIQTRSVPHRKPPDPGDCWRGSLAFALTIPPAARCALRRPY